MTTKQHSSTAASLRRHSMLGLALVAIVVGGAGGWAATSEISGAVVATGSVVVDSNVKKVQHPSGGVVSELKVRDGDHVVAGDVLVRLDDTVTRANLAIVKKQLDELAARKSRLEAERDGKSAVAFPESLVSRSGEAEVGQIISGESRLFASRRESRLGEEAQLRQRIAQLSDEIGGQTAQATAKAQEIVLVKRELDGVRELYKKNLVPISRLIALEREATRLEGEHGQLLAATAASRGKIAETELQILQIGQNLIAEVGKDMRDVESKMGELVERKVTAEDQLKRVELRAPISGIVHQSIVHTVGGVVPAGDTLMEVVPERDQLTVEVRVAPQDIDQLKIGQKTMLRFTAFNRRTTPEIAGTVSMVAADTTFDQHSGVAYYSVRISLPPEEVARLGDVQIMPGMPVEAFIITAERTVLSYLTKPMHDQVYRAFREK